MSHIYKKKTDFKIWDKVLCIFNEESPIYIELGCIKICHTWNFRTLMVDTQIQIKISDRPRCVY